MCSIPAVVVEFYFDDREREQHIITVTLSGYVHDALVAAAYYEAAKWIRRFSLDTLPFTLEEIKTLEKNLLAYDLDEENEEIDHLYETLKYFTDGRLLGFIEHYGIMYKLEDGRLLCCRFLDARPVAFTTI